MIDLLAAPLQALLAGIGNGATSPDGTGRGDVLQESADIVERGVTDLAAVWAGPAADAATALLGAGARTAAALAAHADDLDRIVNTAVADVAAAYAEIVGLLDSFFSWAAAAGPALLTPAGFSAAVAVAAEHISRGSAVVERTRHKLETHIKELEAIVPHRDWPTIPELSTQAPLPAPNAPIEPARSVTLPDGSTATAPTSEAADAVRFALTQQGVPYVWGGTAPGVGLDCSGLTQSAYAQAGVDIPRLAADQDIGSPIDAAAVMPGDLAVWDGHVAMVVGNGMLIEAGDPVAVSPIRTTNSGMNFHGFFRPTQ